MEILIKACCDLENPNQAHALNLLALIIK
jgi:hypothetical protein